MDLDLNPIYKSILKDHRAEFNLQFKLLKQDNRSIADQVFYDYFKALLTCLPPNPDKNAEKLVLALFSALIDLASQDSSLKLNRTRNALEIWFMLIPKVPDLFTKYSGDLLSSLANIVIYLTNQESVRTAEFISTMSRVSPICRDLISLQNLGSVVAWISGLSNGRKLALSNLGQLSVEVCKLLFTESEFNALELSNLWQKNPWRDYSKKVSKNSERSIGEFIGFGGQFLKTPAVESSGEDFIASDGMKHWKLSADCFGYVWQRSNVEPKLSGGTDKTVEGFDEILSYAESSNTIAFTIRNSLRVYLRPRSS